MQARKRGQHTRLPRAVAVAAMMVALSAMAATARVADTEHSGASVVETAGRAAAARDSSAVASAVARYHQALIDGDSAAALALLAADAVILESGGMETRAEYRSHHLAGDIEFARVVRSERGPLRVITHGDVAWATSTSTTRGEYRGRTINSAGAELMVLSRDTNGWKIRAIHWSARTRR